MVVRPVAVMLNASLLQTVDAERETSPTVGQTRGGGAEPNTPSVNTILSIAISSAPALDEFSTTRVAVHPTYGVRSAMTVLQVPSKLSMVEVLAPATSTPSASSSVKVVAETHPDISILIFRKSASSHVDSPIIYCILNNGLAVPARFTLENSTSTSPSMSSITKACTPSGATNPT